MPTESQKCTDSAVLLARTLVTHVLLLFLWSGVLFAALAEACDLGRGQGEAINKRQHGGAVFNSENCAISFKRGGGGAEAAANQDREVSSVHLFSLGNFTETGFVILVFVCHLCGTVHVPRCLEWM